MRRAAPVILALLSTACDEAARTRTQWHDSMLRIAKIDLQAVGATQWTAMHLALVLDLDSHVQVSGKGIPLGECLRAPLLGAQAPLLTRDGASWSTRRGYYYFEYEDHHSQFWAYRALRMASIGAIMDSELSDMNTAFMEGLDEIGSAEPSWLLMLGSLLYQGCEAGGLDGRHVEKCQLLIDSLMHSSAIGACGEMHECVALALAVKYGVCSSLQAEEAQQRLDLQRRHINDAILQDGYMELPGLHDSFHPVSRQDKLRVLGHVVEFLGLAEPPYNKKEWGIIHSFLRLTREALESNQLGALELGFICHGLHGVAWQCGD